MDLERAKLYTFIDTAYVAGRSVADLARQLCDGGSDLIQIRAKECVLAKVLAMAEEVLPITRKAGVPLVVNDRIDVALQVSAPYCHLGQEDFFDAGHRHVSELLPAGTRVRIGLSSHAPSQAERAVQAGAAYLGVGPVFPTATKPEAAAVTLEYVRWAAANIPVPWFAIGGIDLSNLDQVLESGARRICVVSAILKAPDVAKACREFRRRLG